MIRYEARLQGAQEVVKILAKLEPDFAKDARAELRAVGQDVIEHARGMIPDSAMSGWTNIKPRTSNRTRVRAGGFPLYEPNKIAAGMTVGPLFSRQRGSVNRKVISLKQMDAAGMIYERAGSMKYINKPQGDRFVSNIQRKVPGYKQMRLLGKASNDKLGESRARILDIIESVRGDAIESLDRLARTKKQGR